MKKNFKRKNYVLFGAIGIAAVALSSVGFATWITGMQQKEVDANITNITVDTASNDTLYIDAALSDNEIAIRQNAVDNGSGKLSVSGEGSGKTDLDFEFSKFNVYVSDKYEPTSIKVKMTASISGDNVAYNSTLKGFAKTASDKTYIDLPNSLTGESIALTDGTAISGYTVKTIEVKKFSFTWGTIFNGNDPLTHYNGLIGESTDPATVLPIMSTATSTINDMNAALNGKTITLKFTVTADPA